MKSLVYVLISHDFQSQMEQDFSIFSEPLVENL